MNPFLRYLADKNSAHTHTHRHTPMTTRPCGLRRAGKEDKYSGLAADYLFQPLAVETLGPINESASDFFSLLAKKISHHSGDERETAFCSSAFPC